MAQRRRAVIGKMPVASADLNERNAQFGGRRPNWR